MWGFNAGRERPNRASQREPDDWLLFGNCKLMWHHGDVDNVHVERIVSSGDQLLKNIYDMHALMHEDLRINSVGHISIINCRLH